MHMSRERSCYAALCAAVGGDYGALEKARQKHHRWEEAWASLPAIRKTTSPEAAMEMMEKRGVVLILKGEPEYPALLSEIPLAPFGIFVRGKLPLDTRLHIGIVGTRKATREGTELAERFAKALAPHAVIASGLAFGIDAAAHRGCLDGGGTALAVLGSGIDSITPRSNAVLGEEVLENGGALVSEYPFGAPVFPTNFLRRNRIISGLSRGIVFIEVPRRSGAGATARFALEQNRELFVIPGPATHPNYAGSHELIRQGAELVTDPSDVLSALGAEQIPHTVLDPHSQMVLDALRETRTPLDVDKIIETTSLEAHAVNQVLAKLTIQGLVTENEKGYTILS